MDQQTLLDLFKGKDGESEQVKSFYNLPPSVREALLLKVELSENEHPVIGGIVAASNWLLLTTNRVLWESCKGVHSVSLSEICDVSLDSSEVHSRKVLLNEACNLIITTDDQEQLTLTIEAGKPLYAMWNLLLHFVPSKAQFQAFRRRNNAVRERRQARKPEQP